MNTDRDAYRIAKRYGVASPKDMLDSFTWLEKFPWDKIKEEFDAVHHVPSGGRGINLLMSSWDVESTVWFNRRYLQDMGWVKVRPRES